MYNQPPPESNPTGPTLRSWTFARILAGKSYVEQVNRLRSDDRDLADRMLAVKDDARLAIWRDHLEALDDKARDEETAAVAAVDPAAPPPPDEWEEPLLADLDPAPPFPLDVFPMSLRDLILDAAECLSCPPDFLAVSALGVAGAAIGRSAAIELKQTWHETASTYIAIVGQPGVTKSPSISLMTRPVWRITAECLEAHRQAVEQHAIEEEVYAEAKKDARANKLPPPTPPGPGPKAPLRIAVNDSTVEALAPRLQENPRGVIMVRDELTAWISGMNQYKSGGKGSDRQFYLSAWSGTSVAIDRKSQEDGVPTFIPHPFLCVLGGLQPDMLGEMVDERGRNDGFLDRILFTYPEPAQIRWTDRTVDGGLIDEWEDAVRRLWKGEGTVDAQGRARPVAARMTEDALKIWVEWFNRHCEEAEADTFPTSLVGVWSKLRAYAGRLALVVERIDSAYADDPERDESRGIAIEPWAVEAAITLIGYFKAHAARVRSVLRGGNGLENADAKAILRWVENTGRDEFTERQARINFASRFPLGSSALSEALTWLSQRHAIRPKPAKQNEGRGRKPSPAYEVNPLLRPSHQNHQKHQN